MRGPTGICGGPKAKTRLGRNRSGRIEEIVVRGLCVAAPAATLTLCTIYGYRHEGPPRFVLEVPEWVVWGVALPWISTWLLSSLFCLFVMRDEPLDAPAHAALPDNPPLADDPQDGSETAAGADRTQIRSNTSPGENRDG